MTQAGRTVSAVAALLVLASCTEGTGTSGTPDFQKKYAMAREALEAGRYPAATRHYTALLPHAGPMAPRVELELAHTHLRAGRYDQAALTARAAATRLDGEGKAAAQAVLGTAQHEMALAALARGDRGAARQRLGEAQATLGLALDEHAHLDPLGALAGRQAAIKVQLGST